MTKYNCLSDLQLWDLLKRGDRAAYAQVYERYFSVLYIHARNRLKSPEETEDVVQEIFLHIWTNRENICIKTTLLGYLVTMTKNRVLNLISRTSFEGKYKMSLAQGEQSEAMTDHLIREKMLIELINKEIDALPPKMRKVFLMSRRQHLTYPEIANSLDITEQSVRSHVKNALKVLRVKLGVVIYIVLLLFR